MRSMNHGTITGTLSLFKILPLNGFNRIRAKQRRKFLEPSESQKLFTRTINLLEFGKSCEALQWNHRTSTPHGSETNGIAERAVRRVNEGTSAVLLQSGLDERWCTHSVECCCFLRNVQDLLGDGVTPYERRFGEPFKGPTIPLGAMVEYHPISTRDFQDFINLARKC